MFHRAIGIAFGDGTSLEVTFQDGLVKRYDMSVLFPKHPQLRALEDREFFLSGRLLGASGIVWNDELDIEAETVYAEGETVGRADVPACMAVGAAVAAARSRAGLTQAGLAARAGIDQSDVSRIERGAANPSVSTLERIAAAVGGRLSVSM